MTNCPNCGAVVEPAETRCLYCGTRYPKHGRVVLTTAKPDPNPGLHLGLGLAHGPALSALGMNLLTPNEVRALLGLPPR